MYRLIVFTMFFFDTLEHLENFIDASGFVTRIHASERGYQPAKVFSIEDYQGRYGIGLKVRYPSKMGVNGHRTNRFHRIDYIIFR